MNNKGQAQILFIFMIGIVLFFLGLALSPAINDTINETRGSHYGGYVFNAEKSQWEINESAQINCTDASISNQDKAVCTSLDIIPAFFIGIVFGLAGLIIGGIAIR